MSKKVNIKNEIKPEIKQNGIFNYLLPAVFLILVLFATSYKISGDDDIFWHLQIGKYVTENKTVPSEDVFGFATQGAEWIPFEWGFDVLAYNIYNAGGYTLLSIFRSLVFILIFYLIIRLSEKFRINRVIVYFILLILVAGLFERLMIKPQIMSFLFNVLIIYIFISYAFLKREGNKLIYFLPFIFLLWANMHMGVLSGIILFAVFVLSEAAAYFNRKFLYSENNPADKRSLLKIIMMFVLSAVMLLANPHGLHTYTYVYSHLNMKMMEDVYEWYSPFNDFFSGTIFIYSFYFFITAAAVSMFYFFSRRILFSGLSLLVFLFLSFRSARFSVDFMLLSAVFVIFALNSLVYNTKARAVLEKQYLMPFFATVILVTALLIPGNNLYSIIKFERESGFGVFEKDYPFGAVKFLKDNKIADQNSKPFNTYGCGGYLIWEIPGTKNFIDSRAINDDIYFKFKAINNKQPGFEKLLELYDFDYVLWSFQKLPWNNGELRTSIISYLSKSNKYRLVYWDDDSFVFVKNDAKYKDVIDKFEYKYANPYFYIVEKEPLKQALANDPLRVAEEIKRNLSQNPNGVFIQAMAKSFNIK